MTWPRSPGGQRGYGWEWSALRRQVFERDGHRCVITVDGARCAGPAYAADHITSKAEGGSDALSNLRTVCRPCHQKITSKQASKARWRYRARREPERHPGLLP